jgi:hypothetical protein
MGRSSIVPRVRAKSDKGQVPTNDQNSSRDMHATTRQQQNIRGKNHTMKKLNISNPTSTRDTTQQI